MSFPRTIFGRRPAGCACGLSVAEDVGRGPPELERSLGRDRLDVGHTAHAIRPKYFLRLRRHGCGALVFLPVVVAEKSALVFEQGRELKRKCLQIDVAQNDRSQILVFSLQDFLQPILAAARPKQVMTGAIHLLPRISDLGLESPGSPAAQAALRHQFHRPRRLPSFR